jgi:hypothetical protein
MDRRPDIANSSCPDLAATVDCTEQVKSRDSLRDTASLAIIGDLQLAASALSKGRNVEIPSSLIGDRRGFGTPLLNVSEAFNSSIDEVSSGTFGGVKAVRGVGDADGFRTPFGQAP